MPAHPEFGGPQQALREAVEAGERPLPPGASKVHDTIVQRTSRAGRPFIRLRPLGP